MCEECKACKSFVTLKCRECGGDFKILWNYGGVVTCPYCGEYVEG